MPAAWILSASWGPSNGQAPTKLSSLRAVMHCMEKKMNLDPELRHQASAALPLKGSKIFRDLVQHIQGDSHVLHTPHLQEVIKCGLGELSITGKGKIPE